MSEPELKNDTWLGLLKWSLNYVDGTVSSAESPGFTQMSAEDKSFLEEVMKNGIIDEGKRMKTILSSLVTYFDFCNGKEVGDVISTEEATELLFELKDIVEQIDYARSFAVMGGIDFLLGCASKKEVLPTTIRIGCLKNLSTLSQNNPHVQLMMLERGSIAKLLDLYFSESSFQSIKNTNEVTKEEETSNESLRAQIVQVMSSSIRNHDTAEKIFCMNTAGVKMIESGLGLYTENGKKQNNLVLRQKTLFFLQALVTSDIADHDRVSMFVKAIQFVALNNLDPQLEESQEIREMALSMLTRLLDQKKSVNCILDIDVQNAIVSLGVKRVAELRALDDAEKEYTMEELNLWESLITNIARTPRDKVK